MRNRKKDLEEKQTKSRRKRRREKEELVRIEELEELLSKHGDEVDPETIVSMYLPHRKRRKLFPVFGKRGHCGKEQNK